MKRTNFKLLLLIPALFIMLVTSCKKDEETAVDYQPKLNTTFSYTINQTSNVVSFTTTIPGNVWFSANGKDYPTVDKKVDVFLPIKGTYEFVCSSLGSGSTLVSDTFEIVINNTNTEFLNTGIWKALTGGSTGSKHWVLDIVTITTTTIDDAGVSTQTKSYKSAYFHNPLDFYGDAEAGGSETNVWGPWGGTNIYGWGGKPEVGEIKFNGSDLTVTTTIEGVTKTGNFSMDAYDRDPNFCTITANNNNGTETSLWNHMLTNKYSYLHTLSAQMADLSFAQGFRFPMDSSRIAEGQFLDEDLTNVKIIHCSDSALVVRVKRTYEGKNDDGSPKESKCWLLYNYRVKEFDYGVKPSVVHPVKSSITKTDLVGTWKLGAAPCKWIGWSTKDVLNDYTDSASITSTFASWGQANAGEKYHATRKVTVTFNSDNSCVIHNVIFDGANEVATDYNTTFTLTNGYITFGADVTISGFTGMIELTGTHVYVVDVVSTSTGLWLGKNNGDKEETSAVYLLKQ